MIDATNEYFGRIDLSKTNYKPTLDYKVLDNPPGDQVQDIYRKYCLYKGFASVYPLFPSEWTKPHIDFIGYYDNNELVAFSIFHNYLDGKNINADQFAWNYHNPSAKIGYKSLRTECALYKAWGYDYIYIGEHYEYKSEIQGYEILGPMT
jgi:hypothetical protein